MFCCKGFVSLSISAVLLFLYKAKRGLEQWQLVTLTW